MEVTSWSSLVQRTAFQEAEVPTRGRLALPGPLPRERGEERERDALCNSVQNTLTLLSF